MSGIMSVARFRIHAGKADEFRELARECVRIVREKDPGTTVYEWYMNGDGTECIAIDGYASPDAVFAHVRNVGATMRKVLKIADASVNLLGDAPQSLIEALQFKSEAVYGRLDGLL